MSSCRLLPTQLQRAGQRRGGGSGLLAACVGAASASPSLASRILEQEKIPGAQLSEQMGDKSMCSPSRRPGPGSPVTILHWMVVHTSGFQESRPCSRTSAQSAAHPQTLFLSIALCVAHYSLYLYFSFSLNPSST